MKTILSALCAFICITAAPLGAREAAKWVEQKKPALLLERQADGDSFGMTVESAKGNRLERTYRLYGADCPESDGKDARVKERIKEQAAYFACPEKEIPAWGKKATEFTNKLLTQGDPKVYTLGVRGTEALGGANAPQRYHALVEVTAPDGSRRMLHELLIENGLAHAFGVKAAWPEKAAARLGEKEAKERFMKDLERMEKKAKADGRGIWKKP